MALLGAHPLAALWLQCSDVGRSVEFYRDTLGLRVLGEPGEVAHFDAGGIRLSLHPADAEDLPPRGSFLVFLIPHGVDVVYGELEERGVEFAGPLEEHEYGRTAEFKDPDGHTLAIWQPTSRGDSRYGSVAALVAHFEATKEVLALRRPV